MGNSRMTIRRLSLLAVLTTILFVQEQVLTFLPNIQLTFLLIVVFSTTFKFHEVFLMLVIHVLADNLVMGSFNMVYMPFMFLGYLIIPLTLRTIFRHVRKPFGLAFLGILYSLLYSWIFLIPHVLILKWPFKPYLLSDIPFEILLSVSSFLSILWLYSPIKRVLDQQLRIYQIDPRLAKNQNNKKEMNMKKDIKTIGVFDSGVGGLTVLKELVKKFPNTNFIYIADHKYNPYGPKPVKKIFKRSLKISRYLEKNGADLIVIACNTASLHKKEVEKKIKTPIISVIEPTADYAFKISKNKRIGIIATKATVNSKAYQNLLEKEAFVTARETGILVNLIENNIYKNSDNENIYYELLSPFIKEDIDTLILGCTHFEIAKDQIQKVLGKINYVSSGIPTCNLLKEMINEIEVESRKIDFYTTGNIDQKLLDLLNIFDIKFDSIDQVKI